VSSGRTSALGVVRVGGLPCETIEAFSTPLGKLLETRERLKADLESSRPQLVEELYCQIHDAPPAKRHALLALKRDCHNGRPLAPHKSSGGWAFLEGEAERIGENIAVLEQGLEDLDAEFLRAFDVEKQRQSLLISGLLADPMFRCGLAVASPVVSREAARLAEKSVDQYGRREKRLVATLLRYASRTALKLSPFSTFTPVGLVAMEAYAEHTPRLACAWKAGALVRLRRHLLDRCTELLLRNDSFRRLAMVSLNDSALPLSDGRTLYLRPSYYRPDVEQKLLRYERESLVRVALNGELVKVCKDLLAHGPLRYGEFVALAARQANWDMIRVIPIVDSFIEIGWLLLSPPWSSDECYLEKRMLELLSHPDVSELESFGTPLKLLVELQEEFLSSAAPDVTWKEMEKTVDQLLVSAAKLAGIPPEINVTAKPSEHDIYQDVWYSPQAGAESALLRVRKSAMEEALENIEPIARFSRIYDHKLDFLFTFGEFFRQQFDGRAQVPILQAFDVGRTLWQQYMKFAVATRETNAGWRKTWNPLGLQVLEELSAWRARAYEEVEACRMEEAGGVRIDRFRLERFLESVPEDFVEVQCDPCLFLQPASSDGSLWVLNRAKEGTGRFASRYTPLMPPSPREEYAATLSRNGTFMLNGEMIEYLDIHSLVGDTLNVHAVQTPGVLSLSGEYMDVPAGRHRTLRDLVIMVHQNGQAQVRSMSGQRYIPLHLGAAHYDYLPSLVKFLCMFGPTETGLVFPRPLQRQAEEGTFLQERTVIGNVVLHRKSWTTAAAKWRTILENKDEARMFIALQALRRACNIPEQVFALERVPHPIRQLKRYQPQYVDFTSPLFIPILRSIIAAEEQNPLTLVEMLPSIEMFPQDGAGRRWAIELLVDSLAFHPPRAARQGRVGKHENATCAFSRNNPEEPECCRQQSFSRAEEEKPAVF
jgi:hypothetical protein